MVVDYRGIMWHLLICFTFLGHCYGQSGPGRASASRIDNNSGDNSCVSLGEEADGYLEKIDPQKFLFVNFEQKSYLRNACNNYKQMRAQAGCVPEQADSLYSYACDTIASLGESRENAACWNRTTSCALVKLLPPTESITAAYCKFITAAGVQLSCAAELTPACDTPSNAVMSQAATKSRSLLDSFQCSVQAQPSPSTAAPLLALIKGPADGSFVLKSTLPNCNLAQNAKGLMCATNLLGVQEKFSDASGSLIFQELSKDNSSELVQICQQFFSYHDCMGKVFESPTQRCLTKNRIHDFAGLFYNFCDPANQQRIANLRPCVQKLLKITDPTQATAFQQCRQKLANMRAEVRNVINRNQDALALCRGILSAENFFDCSPPIVQQLCGDDAVVELAYFRQKIADEIDLLGCDLNDPRLSNYTSTKYAAAVGTSAPTQPPVHTTPTSANVVVQSNTIGVVDTESKASTIKVDQTLPIAQTNSAEEVCTDNDIRLFSQCYAHISGVDLHPMSVLKKSDQIDLTCQAYNKFDECKENLNLNCTPPAGDGMSNLLYNLCSDNNAIVEYKNHSACMKRIAESAAGVSCANQIQQSNLLALNTNDSCDWVNDVVNCSYNELINKCDIETADYQYRIWTAFGKGVNETTCKIDYPASNAHDMIIGLPVSCDETESSAVNQCMEPFSFVLEKLSALVEGGIQAFLHGLKQITEIFKSGCDTRLNFDSCMKKSVQHGSSCHVSSCLIKVTEYACNFSGTSDMALDDRLRCMWSLLGEPEFSKCLKIFPKGVFSNMNRLRAYLPKFVRCLHAPLLRKCGETTVSLVNALTTQPTADPNDNTCVVVIPGLNDEVNRSNAHGAAMTVARTTVAPNIRASKIANVASPRAAISRSTAAPVIDARPLCKTPDEFNKFERCHNMLNNRSYEPLPIKVFSDPNDLDKACDAYKNFANCESASPCRYEFTSAIKETLKRVCTVRYNDYKDVAGCLTNVADSPRGQECVAPMMRLNLTVIRADNGESACDATNSMIGCISPDIDDLCKPLAMDVFYDLQTAFVKQIKPDCVVKPPVSLVRGTDCTQPEVDAFEKCAAIPKNYSLNPLSIIDNPDQWNNFCRDVRGDFQTCFSGLTCSPKPYSVALNDTLHFACTSDDEKAKFDKYKACLSAVSNTPAGQPCMDSYRNLQWYGGDTPKGNPNKICKAIGSTLTCAAPEISQRCGQDALSFVFDLNQRLVAQIKSDCVLVMPPKPNATTTEGPTTIAKTTPAKSKDAQQQGSGANSIFGLFATSLALCLYTAFQWVNKF